MTEKININNFSEKLAEFNKLCNTTDSEIETNEKQIKESKQHIEQLKNDIYLLNYLKNEKNEIEKQLQNLVERLNFEKIKEEYNKEYFEKERIELGFLNLEYSSISKQIESFGVGNLKKSLNYFETLLINFEEKKKNLSAKVKKINKTAENIKNYINNFESKNDFEKVSSITPENIDNITEYFYLNTATGIANPDFPTKLLRTASNKFDEVLNTYNGRRARQTQQNTIELTEEEKEKINFTKKCILSAILIYNKNKIIQEKNEIKLNGINEFINKIFKFKLRKMGDKIILYKEGSSDIKISEDLKDDLTNKLESITKTCNNLNKQLKKEEYKFEGIKI